jgi:inhibitor of cysteine peptidase
MSASALTQLGNGAIVDVKVNDLVEVSLEENPTTGYRWAAESLDEASLKLEYSGFISHPDAAIGSGGTRTLRFRVVSPGIASIALKKWREWEGNSSVLEHFQATVRASN